MRLVPAPAADRVRRRLMSRPVTDMSEPRAATRLAEYEQPLSERMRTFLRLEFLYQQTLYHSELDADWATRAAISSLLEIMAILSRGDVRSEVLKELERQIDMLNGYRSQPGVDTGRLGALLDNLLGTRDTLNATSPHFLQPLKECEFLSAIKHRSAIPGGTCEFDLPDYSHWLRMPYEQRSRDFDGWLGVLRPACDAVLELLWLTREAARPMECEAANGMYQHNISRDADCRLLRVALPAGSLLFPEISGSQRRFTVRFLEWSDINTRAVQTRETVRFRLSVC